MSLAKLTMISFNSYLNQMYDGQTLFDLLTLPDGINKDDLVDNIMLQGGEFEVLYSDPVFMRQAVGSWGRKCYNTFSRWITAQSIQYNPLENYDRNELLTDQYYKNASSSARRDSGNTRTFDNQDKRTIDTEDERTLDTTRTSEDKVSAYDSNVYQPSEKNTTEDDGTDTLTHSGTDTVDYSGTIKDEYGEGTSGNENENSTNTHSGRVHGNIGVTSSQQLLTSEYEVARFNIIDQITDMFILEFCIPLYD